MSATTIAAVTAGFIIAGLLLIYLYQWRQRTNDERRRQVSNLANRVKRLDTLARSIPAQYIDKKIHLLLVQSGTDAIKKLNELEPRKKHGTSPEAFALLADSIKSGQFIAPAIDPSNEKSGKELRQNLQTLFKFIEKLAKSGRIDKKFANQQLIKTQYFLAKSLADAHVKRADLAEKEQKLRIAIHHLHDAITAYSKAAKNPLAQQSITKYRQRIAQLEVAANKLSQAKTAGSAKSNANSLSDQLEELEGKEAEWKRKQDYED
jgi:hypothetical protein